MQIARSDADTVELSVVVVSRLPPEEIRCIDPLDVHGFVDAEIIIRGDDGIGAARNAGIREASADKLVFLDDDAVPCDGYLKLASELLDEYPIVAGRALDPGDDYFSRMSDSLGYNQGKSPRLTNLVTGCNMAFRREVFDEIGYFDENIKFGHEETLLIEEARNHFNIYYDPDLCVTHRFCDSPVEFWKKWWRYGIADVYLQKCRGNTIPERIHRFIPLTFDETIEGTVVLSVGKALRLCNFLRSKITGSGWG